MASRKSRRPRSVTIDLESDEYEVLSASPPSTRGGGGAPKGVALALAGKDPRAAVALKASQFANQAGQTLVDALKAPIYTNIETETWVEKGRTHTRTHGATIPLGLPVALVAGVAIWEAANYIGQGLQTIAGSVAPVVEIMSPITWPIAAANYIVPKAEADVQLLANWLLANKGKPASQASPAPTGAAVYTRPPTGMASLANFLQSIVDPLAAGLNVVGTDVVTQAFSSSPPSSAGPASLPGAGNSCPSGSTLMYNSAVKMPNGQYPTACVVNASVSTYLNSGWAFGAGN